MVVSNVLGRMPESKKLEIRIGLMSQEKNARATLRSVAGLFPYMLTAVREQWVPKANVGFGRHREKANEA